MLSKIVQNVLDKREPGLLEGVVQKNVKPSPAQRAGMRLAVEHTFQAEQERQQERQMMQDIFPALRTEPVETTIAPPEVETPQRGMLSRIVERLPGVLSPREKPERFERPTGEMVTMEGLAPIESVVERRGFLTPPEDVAFFGKQLEPLVTLSQLPARIGEGIIKTGLEAIQLSRQVTDVRLDESPRELLRRGIEETGPLNLFNFDARRLGYTEKQVEGVLKRGVDTFERKFDEEFLDEQGRYVASNEPDWWRLSKVTAETTWEEIVPTVIDAWIAKNIITAARGSLLKTQAKKLDNVNAWERFGRPQTAQEAKTAYRRLAKEFHPDMPHGSKQMFQALKRDYDKLFVAGKFQPPDIKQVALWERFLPKRIRDAKQPIVARPERMLPGFEGRAGIGLAVDPLKGVKATQAQELARQGLTVSQIAQRLNVTQSAVEATIGGVARDLFHGTSQEIIGGRLAFGEGDIRRGGQAGGLFLTESEEIARVFGRDVFRASGEIREQTIDLTQKENIDLFEKQIGKTYQSLDGEKITFTEQDFNLMFPDKRADFATISQYPEVVEKVVKEQGKRGIAFMETAGGQTAKTYQIIEGEIPVTPLRPPTPTEVDITPTIPEGTPLSTHFERIKPQLDDLATGIGFERINLEAQAKRAFELVEKSPNRALRIAYGIDAPPKGLHPEAVQISLIESLKSAGRIEEATAIARRLSLGLTDTAQKLNIAKIDLGSAGERKIEGIIMDEKLVRMGEQIPKGVRELPPRQRAINKIKTDAEKAIKDSFETTKVGKAEGLLADMRLTGELRTELAKGFAKDNITIEKLYNMSSGQRRDVLEKYVGKEKGKELSGSFERALLSNQKQALRDWVWKNVYEGRGLYKEVELEQAKRMFDKGLRARDLRRLTDEQRISKLSQFVGRRNAELLNERFLKAQKGGTLANWEQRVVGSKDLHTHEKANRILTRLRSIDEMGVLTPDQAKNFMEDFLYIKLGVDVTEAQAKEISRMVKRITSASDKVGDNWTHTNKPNVKEYFRARREMEDYMKKINPDTALDVFTSVGARGSILAALRIPVNSLMFQIVPGITRTISKRVVAPALIPGDYKFLDRMQVMLSGLKHPIVNTEFWREQTKMGIEIYKETGYDIARMQTLEDGFRYFGEKYTNPTGPTWGESKGIAEKMGATVRGHAKLVQPALKYGAGGTDAVFANSHRAGTTQLLARQTAMLDELTGQLPVITERDLVFLPDATVGQRMTVAQREEMLIKEALSFNPQSVQGQYIREGGILDAHHANFTTNDGYGRLAIQLRGLLPKGLGQTIAPFAKIPANALGKGFEATGPGVIMGLQRFVKATKMPPGAEKNTEMAEGLTLALTAGGLLGTALILTSMLDNDDFIGAYDFRARSENNLTTTKNAGANYVRIGGKWVNLRWTGPLAIPISAIMTARKNRAEGDSAVIGYGTGVATGLLEFPVVKEMFGLLKSLERAATSDTITSFLNNAGMDMESVRRWIAVRTIPSIISHDVQGLFDETRYDSLGRPIPEKSFKNFIVGANIKEDTSNVITEEFDRLNMRGYMPVLTDPTGDHIEFLEFFSEVMDDRYYVELLAEKKREYSFRVFELMQSDEYKDMSNEEIKSAIDGIRRKEILDPLREHSQELQKELDMEGITSEEIAWEKVAHKYGRSVSDYARAFSTDPYNAFRALLTEEELGRIEGNLVELQRFYGIKFDEPGGSQDYKKALMNQHGIPWEEREHYKLEHILPVGAGGGNEDANLMLVDTATWQFFTPIDIAVGNAVKDKRLTRRQARDLMIDFKVNRKITAEEVIEAIR